MITKEQLDSYQDQGFLLFRNLFSKEEIAYLNEELLTILADDGPRRVYEDNGEIRSYHGAHQVNELYKKVCCLQRILEPVKEILNDQVYIHQTKINLKKAFKGEWWEWHQDFPYWHIEDGMPQPDVISVMIYLDDVNEYNGPLIVIPGSHKNGIVAFEDKKKKDGEDEEKFYLSTLSSNLKYTIDDSILEREFRRNNVFSTAGEAGSVLFFHGNLFHASNGNISPYDRKTYIITYNSVSNKLQHVERRRPIFLSEKDTTAIHQMGNNLMKVVGDDVSLVAE